MHTRIVVAMTLFILTAATAASAGMLVSGTLWAEEPVSLACNITNVSGKDRSVQTRIINGSTGEVMLTEMAELQPGRTLDATVEGLAGGGPIYCAFEFGGKNKHFRGVAKLWGGPSASNSSDITAIPAH